METSYERTRRAWDALTRRGVAGMPTGRGRGTESPYDASDEFDSIVMERDAENAVFDRDEAAPLYSESEAQATADANDAAHGGGGDSIDTTQTPETWGETASRWFNNAQSWLGNFDAREAARRLTEDEELTIDEATGNGFGAPDVGKIISGIGDTITSTRLWTKHVYNMKGTEYLERCQRIQDELGVDGTALSEEAFDKAWRVVQEIDQKKKLAGVTDESGHVNMDKLYEAMPYLETLHEAHGDAGVLLAMDKAQELIEINDLYKDELDRLTQSIATGFQRGFLNLRYQLTGLGAMPRGFLQDVGLTNEEIQEIFDLSRQMEALPQYSYSTAGGAVGGALGSAAENVPMIATDMLASAVPYAGTFLSLSLMASQIAGGNYIDYLNKTDENGNPLYTPRDAATFGAIKAIPNALIEKIEHRQIKNAILGAGTAKKLGELYAKREAAIMGGESLRQATQEIIKERVSSAVKGGLLGGASEIQEEFSQSVSDAVFDNMSAILTRGADANLKSTEDILSDAIDEAIQAAPAVVGFGMIGAGGNVIANTRAVLNARERFKRAQGNRLIRETYENEYRENVIDAVGSSLGNIEDLNGKHPDMVKTILDAENEKNGMKETDVDIRALSQKEGGADVLNQLAAAAGKTQDEIDACLADGGTGVMTFDTSTLQQVTYKLTPEQKATLRGNMAAVGGQTTEQIKEYAKILGDAVKALDAERVKNEAASVDSMLKESFEDDETRELATDIVAANLNNPALEARNRIREVQSTLDEILNPVREGLRAGMEQGVDLIRETDENGQATDRVVGRVSNNAEWYRNFYADNKRPPTQEEFEQIVYENAIGTATRYALGTLNDGSQEAQEYYANVKAEIDGLRDTLNRLNQIAGVFSNYNAGEFVAHASMPEGARQAYDAIYAALKQTGMRAVSTNARVNAILAARMAERIAQGYREAGKDVKAVDILPRVMGMKNAQNAGGLHQFAGEHAKGANEAALQKAIGMMWSGKTAEEIFKETGWVQGKDGKWRFEIPDDVNKIDFAKLKTKRGVSTLEKVYDNPALFEAYPFLKKVRVVATEYEGDAYHGMSYGRTIEISKKDLAEDEDEACYTLVHEIQHLIQNREGFASGGTPEDAREILGNRLKNDPKLSNMSDDDLYLNLAGEQEARYTEDRAEIRLQLDQALENKADAEEKLAEALKNKNKKAEDEARKALFVATLQERQARNKLNKMPMPHDENAIVIFGDSAVGKVSALTPQQSLDAFLQSAWHGSGAVFDAFDLGAIGTGEGAQAHGWGLYFAQNRKIAEEYRDRIGDVAISVEYNGERYFGAGLFWNHANGDDVKTNAEAFALNEIQKAEGNKDKAKKELQNRLEEERGGIYEYDIEAAIDLLDKGDFVVKRVPLGSLFQVEIPDSDVMLDEQKLFDEQPEAVQVALGRIAADKRIVYSTLFFQSPSKTNANSIMGKALSGTRRNAQEDKAALIKAGRQRFGNMSGREIYKEISDRFDRNIHIGSKHASFLFNKFGIKGITYVGQTDGRCFVVFDDKAIAIIERLNQQANAATERIDRGAYSPSERVIGLFKDADQSTFMHEMAHFYLGELETLAGINPDGQAAKDLATVNEWAEWHDGDAEAFKGTAAAKEFADREAAIKEAEKKGDEAEARRLKYEWRQEKFARAFEEYLREGKAPTTALRKIFRAFSDWLSRIYLDVIGVGVKASPEVEAVMARMVATNEEIEMQAGLKEAEFVSRVNPDLLDSATASMRDRWAEEAKAEAKEMLLKELIKEQEEKDVEAHMEAFEESERERLAQDPAFGVAEMLATMDLTEEEAAEAGGYNSVEAWRQDLEKKGGSFDAALSASLEAERRRYVEEMPNQERISQLAEEALASSEYSQRLTALEAEILKRRERRYANAPKRLAEAFRDLEDLLEINETGDPLQAALYKLKYAHRWADKQAEQIAAMQATIEKMKETAQEDNKRLRTKLKKQMQELKNATMQNAEWLRGVRDAARGNLKDIRLVAIQQLASMSVKDATNFRRFVNEAKKAAQESIKHLANATRKNNGKDKQDGGDREFELARQAKMRQTLYEIMAAESLKYRRELDKIRNDMKRVQRGLVNAKGEIDASTRYYLGHIQYMLGFRGKDALKPQSLINFAALFRSLQSANAENGNVTNIGDIDSDVDIPQWLYELAIAEKRAPGKYTDYTIEELQDMRRLVDMLYTTARNKNGMLSEGLEGKVVSEITAELADDFQKTVTVEKGDEGISNFFAKILKPVVMLKTLGPAWEKYFYRTLLDGWEKQQRMQMKAAEELNALFDKYYPNKGERRKMRKDELHVTMPDGTPLTKENVLAMALNWGNDGNRLRLRSGMNASDVEIEDIFRQVLTEKDWAFVQEAWDYINTFGDGVNDVVEKLTGSPMIRVKPQEFTIETLDGQTVKLRGGYYPIAYDPKKSTLKAEQELTTSAKASGGMVFSTGMSSTKARAQAGLEQSPLLYSLDVLFRHVNQQIHITAMRLACRDVYKLLQNKEIRYMVEHSIGREAYMELKRWCENVWQEPLDDRDPVKKALEWGRRNTVAAIMGYRVSVAVLNFANPTLMMREMGVVDTVLACLDCWTSKGARKRVLDNSPFLRNRANNIDRDIRHAQKNSFTPDNPLMDAVARTSSWLIERTDLFFSLPTYHWTYKQTYNASLEKGMTQKQAEKEAHYAAEEKVRKIFGSADTVDQSHYQRSKDVLIKALTPFYTYVSTQANAVFEEYMKGRYQGSDVTITNTGEVSAARKSFMRRWGAMIHAALFTYVLETAVEQMMRDYITYLTRGDDDEPWDLKGFMKRYASQSLTTFTAAIPLVNLAGEGMGQFIMDEHYPTRGMGVISSALSRVWKPFSSGWKFATGKGDAIELGRDVAKAANTLTGFPDTLTDAAFNLARAYNENFSAREVFWKALFDKKLKPKKKQAKPKKKDKKKKE